MPSQLRAVTTQYVILQPYYHILIAASGPIFSLRMLLMLGNNCINKGQMSRKHFRLFCHCFSYTFLMKAPHQFCLKYIFFNQCKCMPSQLKAVTTHEQYIFCTTVISHSSLAAAGLYFCETFLVKPPHQLKISKTFWCKTFLVKAPHQFQKHFGNRLDWMLLAIGNNCINKGQLARQ